MYESLIEGLKEHIRHLDLSTIKEFLVEFTEKLRSSNNLACLIALLCIDVLAIAFILKSHKERRVLLTNRCRFVAPYGLSIGDRYFPFSANEILIGRHTSCDIRSVNLTVSRYHAIVSLRDGQWCIEDMQSTHGTFVNGQRVEGIMPIHAGDVIRLGEQHFTVETDESHNLREV